MISIRTIRLLGLLLLTHLMIPERVYSQNSPFDPKVFEQASQIREHMEVFTDRSLYIVDEIINFRADLSIEGLEEGRIWSTILYAELVTAGGLPVSRGKFSLIEGLCKGSLPIPLNTLSGWYYLKCYTRWMRNLGPDVYSYTPLRIINPLRSELEAQSTKDSAGEGWERSAYRKGGIEIEITDLTRGRGEEVLVNLSLSDEDLSSEMRCCISVVPEFTLDPLGGQLFQAPLAGGRSDFRVEFLPDLFGPTLSGRANPGQRIHLSLLGDNPNYYATVADEFGRFVVAIPDRGGRQDLFVAPEAHGDQTAEVRVDQDFDTENVLLNPHPFVLTPDELKIATLMARRVQLTEAFKTHGVSDTELIKEDSLPFYGKSTITIELDEFVSLPTLTEVFINLVPAVLVLKRKDQSTLVVQGDNPALKIYPPLLMVDQIPVFNHQKVLAIPPEKIRRIDVINDVYVKGQIYHGGIINLITHQNDMGGIDLPEGSYFFDYQGLYELPVEFSATEGSGSRIPDSRNTMLWISDLTLTSGGDVNFKFVASDYPGKYVILVRGVAPDGELFSARAEFSVK